MKMSVSERWCSTFGLQLVVYVLFLGGKTGRNDSIVVKSSCRGTVLNGHEGFKSWVSWSLNQGDIKHKIYKQVDVFNPMLVYWMYWWRWFLSSHLYIRTWSSVFPTFLKSCSDKKHKLCNISEILQPETAQIWSEKQQEAQCERCKPSYSPLRMK